MDGGEHGSDPPESSSFRRPAKYSYVTAEDFDDDDQETPSSDNTLLADDFLNEGSGKLP